MSSFSREQLLAEQARRQGGAQPGGFSLEQLQAEQSRRQQSAPQPAQPQQAQPQQAQPQQAQQPEQIEAANPRDTLPQMIGGVELDDALRDQIIEAQQIEDPKARRKAAARITGQLQAKGMKGNSQGLTALRSIGAGLFGLGDIAATGGQLLGQAFDGQEGGMSFGEALELQRGVREGMESINPTTAVVSEVGGALAGGGGALKLLSRFSKGSKPLKRIADFFSLQKGQKLGNTARLAGVGGAAGGVTEAILTGDGEKALQGAAFGAGGGLAGVALAKGVGLAANVTKNAVRAVREDPQAKGLRTLAKRLGVPEDEIIESYLQLQAVTGKPPTMAELASPQARAELRELIAASPSATRIAQEGADRALSTRSGEVADQLAGRGRITSTTEQRAARKARGDAQFTAVREQPVTFADEQVKSILDQPQFMGGLTPNLRQQVRGLINEAGEGGDVVLPTGLVDDMRQALNKRAGPNPSGDNLTFRQLADDLTEFASDQVPEFAEAIADSARGAQRVDGVALGRTALNSNQTREFVDEVGQRAGASDFFGIGAREGARTAVTDAAREGVQGSRQTLARLKDDTGLIERLRSVMSRGEVDRLQNIARLQSDAIDGIQGIAPPTQAQLDDAMKGAVGALADAAVVASPSTSSASKVFSVSRAIKRIIPGGGPSDRVLENISRDLFDPEQTQKAINALRKLQVQDADIIDIMSAAAAGGTISAGE